MSWGKSSLQRWLWRGRCPREHFPPFPPFPVCFLFGFECYLSQAEVCPQPPGNWLGSGSVVLGSSRYVVKWGLVEQKQGAPVGSSWEGPGLPGAGLRELRVCCAWMRALKNQQQIIAVSSWPCGEARAEAAKPPLPAATMHGAAISTSACTKRCAITSESLRVALATEAESDIQMHNRRWVGSAAQAYICVCWALLVAEGVFFLLGSQPGLC